MNYGHKRFTINCKQKISYKEYSSDEEEYNEDDFCLPQYKLCDNFILKELSFSPFSDLFSDTSYNKIYFVRLWSRSANQYFYKIGKTTDLGTRLGVGGLNAEFDCCGNILMIGCAISFDMNDEKNIHKLLDNHRITDIQLRNERKGKSKESYEISQQVFNIWNDYVNKKCSSIFTTNKYFIDEDSNEYIF